MINGTVERGLTRPSSTHPVPGSQLPLIRVPLPHLGSEGGGGKRRAHRWKLEGSDALVRECGAHGQVQCEGGESEWVRARANSMSLQSTVNPKPCAVGEVSGKCGVNAVWV